MHPEMMRFIATQQTAELHASARATGRVRRAKDGQAAASLPAAGSGPAAAVRGRYFRRLRLPGREVPAQTQPA